MCIHLLGISPTGYQKAVRKANRILKLVSHELLLNLEQEQFFFFFKEMNNRIKSAGLELFPAGCLQTGGVGGGEKKKKKRNKETQVCISFRKW